MKLEPHDLANLQLMLATMRKARRFVEGVDETGFEADDKTTFAVVRAVKIISETAQRVPRTISERHPAIRWQGLAGLYDALVAEDLSVDLPGVWQTVTERLPQVEPVLAQVIAELQAEAEDDARG